MAVSQCRDGPAAGQTFSTRRAPMYLRVVLDSSSSKWDALDQPDDVPRDREAVYVYEAVAETWSFMFVRPGGRFEGADYRHRPDVNVNDLGLRDTATWREWATSQPPIKMPSPALEAALEKARVAQGRISRRVES